MDLVHLTRDMPMSMICSDIYAISFDYLRKLVGAKENIGPLMGLSILTTQMLLQDAINDIGNNREEVDDALRNVALTLIAKWAIDSFDRIDGCEADGVARLQDRSKRIKTLTTVQDLSIGELRYWLKWGSELSDADRIKCVNVLVDWLPVEAKATLDYIIKMDLNKENALMSRQTNLFVI